MVFDKIFNRLRPIKKSSGEVNDANFWSNTTRDFCYVPDSKAIYLLLPPWHGSFRDISKVKKRVLDMGFSFLSYEFPPDMLSSDAELTHKCFTVARDSVCRDLSELVEQYGINEVNLIGVSLGCVNAMMIINSYRQINEVTLIVPGNCLAESLWYGIRTQYLKREFEAQGITLQQLKQTWHDLAPENNLTNVNCANLTVLLSKSDKSIPYRCGRKLVDAMNSAGLNPEVRENRFLGHYGTVIKAYSFPRQIVLKSKK